MVEIFLYVFEYFFMKELVLNKFDEIVTDRIVNIGRIGAKNKNQNFFIKLTTYYMVGQTGWLSSTWNSTKNIKFRLEMLAFSLIVALCVFFSSIEAFRLQNAVFSKTAMHMVII